MIIYRIKIKKYLLGDFYPAKYKTRGTIIFLGGLPSYLHKSRFAIELARKGYNIIQPFYYGTWVSGGGFSPENCLKTVRDTISEIKKGKITDLYSSTPLNIKSPAIYLGGISFGTNVVQSFPKHKDVKKTFLISGVPIWKKPYLSKFGLTDKHFVPFLQRGFPNVYRTHYWSKWTSELRGQGDVFNKFRADTKNMIVFQGSKDKIKPSILKECLKKENIPLSNIKIISNAEHSLDEYNQVQLANYLNKFLSS